MRADQGTTTHQLAPQPDRVQRRDADLGGDVI